MSTLNAVIVFSSLTATFCAMILVHRAANRRIRYLAVSIGLLAICHSTLMVPNQFGWSAFAPPEFVALLQLTTALLVLAVVHFLYRENQDRRGINAVVRCFEAEDVKSAEALLTSEEAGAVAPRVTWPVATPQAESDFDRRRAPRYRIGSSGVLRVDGMHLARQDARVVNISRTGVCMHTAHPLTLGGVVEVEIFERSYRGVVVRSRAIECGYEHGVKLESDLTTGDVAAILRGGLEAAKAALVS